MTVDSPNFGDRRTPPGEASVKLWRALKRAGADGLTATDAAAAKIASAPFARKTMRAWASAGLASYISPATTARDDSGRYVMVADAPAQPPIVRTSGEVEPRAKAAMKPEQLAAIRRRLGLSLGEMGSALGWTGKQPTRARAIKRFESGERPIDAALATKVRALRAPE